MTDVLFIMAPIICLMVSLMVLLILLTCLMMRPSAKRTILLTSPLLVSKMTNLTYFQGISRQEKEQLQPRHLNHLYNWIVQPLAEDARHRVKHT